MYCRSRSLVKRLVLFFGLFIFTVVSLAETLELPKSLSVKLNETDVQKIANDVKETKFNGPQTMNIDFLEIGYYYGFNLSAKDLKVDFEIGDVDVDIENGHVIVASRLLWMRANARLIHFNQSQYCKNTNLWTRDGQSLPFSVKLSPQIQGEKIFLDLANYQLRVIDGDIAVGSPQYCDVFFGMNWLIEAMLPILAEGIVGELTSKFKTQVKDIASEVSEGLNQLTSIHFEIPLPGIGPLKETKTLVELNPVEVRLASGSLDVLLSATADITHPDYPSSVHHKNDPIFSSHPSHSVSQSLLIPMSFFQVAANDLLNGELIKNYFLDRNNTPELSFAFSTDLIHQFIPKAKSQFPDLLPIQVKIKGLDSLEVKSDLSKQQLGAIAKNLRLELWINDTVAYTLLVSGSLPVKPKWDQASSTMYFNIENLDGIDLKVFSSESLDKPLKTDKEGLRLILDSLQVALQNSKLNHLLSLKIPEIRFLNLGVQVEGYVLSEQGIELKLVVR